MQIARCLLLVALLVAGSSVFASSAAPNVQVNVKQGRTTLFTGITDASGRFTTVPMEPGVYTFELRALKTAPPAQYFLLLSGAKPVSAPMADKKAVLMMDAQVRRPRSVTGQVTARRLRIVAPPSASPAPEVSSAPVRATAVAAAPATSSVAVPPARATTSARVAVPVGARSAAPAAQVSARRATASDVVSRSISTQPSAPRPPAATPAAATPAAATPAAARPAAARPVARAAATPTARPANTRTRIINGKPHIWVPIAPGSTLGRWVPGQP